MVQQKIGRLPVVTRADPRRPVGILTRSDLLEAHERRIDASTRSVRSLVILPVRWRGQA
jgi:chloride channel protein, CIC family